MATDGQFSNASIFKRDHSFERHSHKIGIADRPLVGSGVFNENQQSVTFSVRIFVLFFFVFVVVILCFWGVWCECVHRPTTNILKEDIQQISTYYRCVYVTVCVIYGTKL